MFIHDELKRIHIIQNKKEDQITFHSWVEESHEIRQLEDREISRRYTYIIQVDRINIDRKKEYKQKERIQIDRKNTVEQKEYRQIERIQIDRKYTDKQKEYR